MKPFAMILPLLGFVCSGFSQETLTQTLSHDGIERSYILYIPNSYTGDTPVPLVFNFHGYTSNANEQMWYGDFRPIADTAGFLLVHPQGTSFQGSTHWNVGGWTVGSTVDDVGFTEAMIDELAVNYNIDLSRVYATGMSNGGFMSFLLACQLSDKIAAVASVTGSMTPETYDNCTPEHPTPVLQIHGNLDPVVPYNGAGWTKPIADVLQYWVDYNNCNATPTTTQLPNTSLIDGSTAAHMVYDGGDYATTVEHFEVTGGAHTWPGTLFSAPGTNQDFDASVAIWRFFARYDLDALMGTTDTDEVLATDLHLQYYPNPTNGLLYLEHNASAPLAYEIFTPSGIRVLAGAIPSGSITIDCSQLAPSVYFLRIGGKVFKIVKSE